MLGGLGAKCQLKFTDVSLTVCRLFLSPSARSAENRHFPDLPYIFGGKLLAVNYFMMCKNRALREMSRATCQQ
jgi:hypothetical protein